MPSGLTSWFGIDLWTRAGVDARTTAGLETGATFSRDDITLRAGCRLQQRWSRSRALASLLGAAFGMVMILAGCSHPPANTYQGYIEGKFVYVASPQSGRLDHLAVARGETVAVKQPLFAFDREPEKIGRAHV